MKSDQLLLHTPTSTFRIKLFLYHLQCHEVVYVMWEVSKDTRILHLGATDQLPALATLPRKNPNTQWTRRCTGTRWFVRGGKGKSFVYINGIITSQYRLQQTI